MQVEPHLRCLPIAKTPPASHAAAKAQLLGKFFPRDACAQHEHDAIESLLVTQSWPTAFGRRCECWQQRLDLLEERSADFFVLVPTHVSSNVDQALDDDRVMLAALSSLHSVPRLVRLDERVPHPDCFE